MIPRELRYSGSTGLPLSCGSRWSPYEEDWCESWWCEDGRLGGGGSGRW